LTKLQTYASSKGGSDKVRIDAVYHNCLLTRIQLLRKVAMVDIANVEDLALDFTIPGYDIELRVCDKHLPSLLLLMIFNKASWTRNPSDFRQC
jgi:E3 ubiquitin-protein ligase TRIP12